MTEEPFYWEAVHEQILLESFERLSPDEAVALCGILYEYRIRFTKDLWEFTVRADRRWPLDCDPLVLGEACHLVGRQFGYRQDTLVLMVKWRWHEIKGSGVFKRVKHILETHRYVEGLYAWP